MKEQKPGRMGRRKDRGRKARTETRKEGQIEKREAGRIEEKGMERETEGSKEEGFAINISCFKRDKEWQKSSPAPSSLEKRTYHQSPF